MGKRVNPIECDEYGCDGRQQQLVELYLRDPRRRKWRAYLQVYRPELPLICTSVSTSVAKYVFSKPAVRLAIRERVAQINERYSVEREKVVRSIAESSFINLADLFDDNGVPLSPHELPEHVGSAVQSFEAEVLKGLTGDPVGVKYKIKLVDKRASRDQLARILNLYKDHEAASSKGVEMVAEVLKGIIGNATGASRGLPSKGEEEAGDA